MNCMRIRFLGTVALMAAVGAALAGPAGAFTAPAPHPYTAVGAPGEGADPLTQIVWSIAQAADTGSAVPLPQCTPGDVVNIGCEPRR